MKHAVFLLFLLLFGCAVAPSGNVTWRIVPQAIYRSGQDEGIEIVSVQQSSLRAVVSTSVNGEVIVLDLSQPGVLRSKARFDLGLSKAEQLTSVAFHPTADFFAAAIVVGSGPGRLQIHSATTGRLLDQATVGIWPDAVVFSPNGAHAVIANEAEPFLFDRNQQQFFSPQGSISLVRIAGNGKIRSVKQLALADLTDRPGIVQKQFGRYLERSVDWNGDGIISEELDFDGNGKIEEQTVLLGRFAGEDVLGIETKGEREIRIPLGNNSPDILEPEYAAVSRDSKKAYITLQEANAVVVVDLIKERIVDYIGLGMTRHQADIEDNDSVEFDHNILALREPDGIAVTADGRYFITADEGDTVPKASKEKPEKPLGGGRTVSVFDARTGVLLGDTGNQIDSAAYAHEVYPENRSGNKGSEPEMLTAFELQGKQMLAVGLERADAVVLISLVNPLHPRVEALAPIPGNGAKGPEGIAHYVVEGQHYLLTANEKNGTVTSFRITR